MESTLFINLAARVARKTITGSELPSAGCRLLAQWQVAIAFFEPGEEVAALDIATTFRFALKATPTGQPLLFTSSLILDEGVYYADFSSVDSAALRALLGDQASVVVIGELEWTLDARRERVHFPVSVVNAWLRPDDVAPDPVAEASVTWLNEQLAARITAAGYFELQNEDGDWFHLPLNSGHAPG